MRYGVVAACICLAGCTLSGVRLVEPAGGCVGATCVSATNAQTSVAVDGAQGMASFDEFYAAPLGAETEVRLNVTRQPNFHFTISAAEIADPPAGEEYGVWLFRVEPVMARQVGVLVRVPDSHTYAASFTPVGDWGDFDRVILTRQSAVPRVPFSAVVKLREITLSPSAS